VITVNVDDLESIQLNQKEEKEEEMDGLEIIMMKNLI
jgi:hypothetical protein